MEFNAPWGMLDISFAIFFKLPFQLIFFSAALYLFHMTITRRKMKGQVI